MLSPLITFILGLDKLRTQPVHLDHQARDLLAQLRRHLTAWRGSKHDDFVECGR